jgi:hypothetical protein
MPEDATGIPVGDEHPGAFGYRRKMHTHEGVDLYCPEGTEVYPVEDGIVVGVLPFTGPHAGSSWWRDTYAVLVEGASGVVVYGEIIPDVQEGDLVNPAILLGKVTQVLTKDKGRPMTMLHLELHEAGTRDVYEWEAGGERPESLRDPTPFLQAIPPL